MSQFSDFYRGKLFAGPMVRGSCLPFRLLCLEYGADGVYSPATSVDAILNSTITDNDPNTLYFGWPDDPHVHFHTSEKERGKLVFQLVGHDPARAVQAVEKVFPLISAIDLNCGCPESFATSKGDGSALMKDPATVSDVISTLRRNFDLPISVKHRIHNNIEESIQFAVAAQNAGASGIAVHGRLKEQKNKGSVDYDDMKLIFEHINVAKIGNGGVKSRKDAFEMMKMTGCESVIISSAALKNPSVFLDEPKDILTVARRYIEIVEENCKERREWRWTLNSMLGKHRKITKSKEYEKLSSFKDISQFREVIFPENAFSS